MNDNRVCGEREKVKKLFTYVCWYSKHVAGVKIADASVFSENLKFKIFKIS